MSIVENALLDRETFAKTKRDDHAGQSHPPDFLRFRELIYKDQLCVDIAQPLGPISEFFTGEHVIDVSGAVFVLARRKAFFPKFNF